MTNIAPSTSTTTQSEWRKPRPALDGKSLLHHLFNRLDGAYPGTFKSKFPDAVSLKNWEDTWEDGFIRENIHPREIALGLTRLSSGYSPSLPEFLALCRPVLDPETAFREAAAGVYARRQGQAGAWTHPAIYHAALDVGQNDIVNGSYAAMRSRWTAALTRQMEKKEWDPVPAAVIALPEPKKTEISNEEAKRVMKKLGADNVLTESGRDPKAWAVKVLANPSGKTLFAIAAARAVVNGAPA